MEEKKLKGDLVEITRSLRAKFDTENAKGVPQEDTQPKEIFMICSKRGRQEGTADRESLVAMTQALTLSVLDPRPEVWTGDNPLIVQTSIKNVVIHKVYIDTGNSADNIYEHCFRLLPDRWKEFLGPTTRRLVGITGHSLWPLGTIHLPLTLTSDKSTTKENGLGRFCCNSTLSGAQHHFGKDNPVKARSGPINDARNSEVQY